MSDAAERSLIWRLLLLAATIFTGYGISASATQQLFVDRYGAAYLPGAWAAIGVCCLPAVALLTWALRTYSVADTLRGTSMLCAGGFALLLLALHLRLPGATYGLFIFKDVYIVLFSELFWSLVNGEIDRRRAVGIYGFFCAAGSLGGVLGNLLAGPGANYWALSNATVLWLIVPLCALVGGFTSLCTPQLRAPGLVAASQRHSERPSLAALVGAFGVVRGSRLLPLILLLVLTAQVSLTVAEYHFNLTLSVAYPEADARRALYGYLSAAINLLSLALQLGTGAVVRLLGSAGVLRAVPLSLAICVGVQLLLPRFVGISLVRLVGKSNDYSLFRAIKEALYIPLTYKERTAGKAVIDMLAYRLAKAPAAALIWGTMAVGGEVALSLLNGGLCLVWLGTTQAILRRQAAEDACDDLTPSP